MTDPSDHRINANDFRQAIHQLNASSQCEVTVDRGGIGQDDEIGDAGAGQQGVGWDCGKSAAITASNSAMTVALSVWPTQA
ncbi:MAG: hypothetical protein H7338_12645 [Candidatus Sericytochromatia bacterium]|nr:hypothetical protein [Candidatus Sericytochromatia bacterium]